MLTNLKSTMHVLCMPMHLSSGHVILLMEKVHSRPNVFPIGLRTPGRLTLGFPHKFLVLNMFYYSFFNARFPRSVGQSPRNFATCYKCPSKSLEVYLKKNLGAKTC